MRLALTAAACCAALAFAACGSGERTFESEELVDALNEQGAGLVLGEPLESIGTGTRVNDLSFEGSSAGGAMTELDSADAARGELARCETSISFVCFRVANVVMRFEGIRPRDQTQLSLAMMALEGEG